MFLVVLGQKILALSGLVMVLVGEGGRSAEGQAGRRESWTPQKYQNQRKSPNTKAKGKTPRATDHSYTPGAQARWWVRNFAVHWICSKVDNIEKRMTCFINKVT